MTARKTLGRTTGLLIWASMLCLAPSADAAFPGANGKIAFSAVDATGNADIYTLQPDGSGETRLTTHPASDQAPKWSPDGKRIAFVSTRDDPNPTTCAPNCLLDVYVMNADGTNVQHVTPTASPRSAPTWSPDGTEIAFLRQSDRLLSAIQPDGTGQRDLGLPGTSSECCVLINDPAWSPDGTLIAFDGDEPGYVSIRTVRSDGSGIVGDTFTCCRTVDWSPNGHLILFDNTERLMVYEFPSAQFVREYALNSRAGVWSPDGAQIAFIQAGEGLNVMNADGTGATPLVPSSRSPGRPDWQPIPLSYARPRGATPFRTYLVPAYQACTSPNRTHGSALAFPSCNPPALASGQLTFGTPDVNGRSANGSALVYLGTRPTDVTVGITIRDVRRASDLADYTGELELTADLRITDRSNSPSPGGPGPGTVQDTSLRIPVSCASTSSTSVGSECTVATTVNSIYPGAVLADHRSIWRLGPVKAYDGGPDGLVSTSAGNTLFMTQGVFVP